MSEHPYGVSFSKECVIRNPKFHSGAIQMLKAFLRNLYFRVIGKPQLASSQSYIRWLKSLGVKMGDGVIVFNPQNIKVDVSRPELLEIGDNVLLHDGTEILTHDFASRAFVTAFNEFIPSHGRVKIGNNVWLGKNVKILKGVTIGDNVIIGYGSIVSKSIPSNSVAVGAPAKVICSFEDYFKKRQMQYTQEAIEFALAIYRSGRNPRMEDFFDDYPVFVDGRNFNEYNYPYSRIFRPEQFEVWKKSHNATFNGWEEFMAEVDRQRILRTENI